jgi:hypothetical protein
MEQGMSSLTRLLQKRRALAAKRDELDAELRKLDQQIMPRVESIAAASEGAQTSAASIEADVAPTIQLYEQGRVAMTVVRPRPKLIAFEAEKILREAKRPMKTGELYEALKARGVEVPGKIPQNNLSAHLAHHKDIFVNDGRNGWSLRQQNFMDAENANAHP